MSEEKKEPLSPAAEQENGPSVRASSRNQQIRRQRSVFQYIAILFAAAFVLLLFTFVMERRQSQLLIQQSEEQIDDLQRSVSAVQSLQNLYDENAALHEQVEGLKDQLAAMENEAASAQTAVDELTTQLKKTREAMDWFWQLDEAYVRGRYSLCRDIISTMEDTSAGSPLKDYLPVESATHNDRFSPYHRYQEIRDKLS